MERILTDISLIRFILSIRCQKTRQDNRYYGNGRFFALTIMYAAQARETRSFGQ